MLFDESQCFQIECFTKTCLDILKSQNIVIFDQGLAKILKFTPACQAEALRLVRQCCVVTRESVKAEFPHFDIIIAFKAFRLSDGCLATSIDKSAALQRLCQLWEVDFDKTLGEFQMLFRVAQVQQKQTDVPTRRLGNGRCEERCQHDGQLKTWRRLRGPQFFSNALRFVHVRLFALKT